MQRLLSTLLCIAAIFTGCTDSRKDDEAAPEDGYSEYDIAQPPEKAGTGPETHIVRIMQMKFVPDVLNVHKGDTIMWINDDLVEHDVTEQTLMSWTSSRLSSGSSWKVVATNSETYYCSLHVIMKGQIVVDGRELAMLTSTYPITQCD